MFKNDLSNLLEGEVYVIEYKLPAQREVRYAKMVLIDKNNRTRVGRWSAGSVNCTFSPHEVRHYWVLDAKDQRLPLYFNRRART